VIGICNGFQVLTEAGLLPGVLLRNKSLLFICKYLHLRVENAATKSQAGARPAIYSKFPLPMEKEITLPILKLLNV